MSLSIEEKKYEVLDSLSVSVSVSIEEKDTRVGGF